MCSAQLIMVFGIWYLISNFNFYTLYRIFLHANRDLATAAACLVQVNNSRDVHRQIYRFEVKLILLVNPNTLISIRSRGMKHIAYHTDEHFISTLILQTPKQMNTIIFVPFRLTVGAIMHTYITIMIKPRWIEIDTNLFVWALDFIMGAANAGQMNCLKMMNVLINF